MLMKLDHDHSREFWSDALAIRGSVTPRVMVRVLTFAILGLLIYELDRRIVHIELGIEIAPYEFAGAALGLLLVLRTNAGYDRWWEARRLWGGITNQSRNLMVTALAHGPDDLAWRWTLAGWAAALPHIVRHSLRDERTLPRVAELLGPDEAARIEAAEHMPGYAALRIAEILADGRRRLGMDGFAFLQAEQTRALLVDHLGGCERIRKTPLPLAYRIVIRRFVVLFLATLPFALLPRIGWLTPWVTLLIAYPILALDDIGAELQNPFDVDNVGHLPLDSFCDAIEANVLALAGAGQDRPGPGTGERPRPRELDGLATEPLESAFPGEGAPP